MNARQLTFLALLISVTSYAGNYGLNVSGFPPSAAATVHYVANSNFFHNYNGDCGNAPTNEGNGNSGSFTFTTDASGEYHIAPSTDKDAGFGETSMTITGSDGGINWTMISGTVGCGTITQNTYTISGDFAPNTYSLDITGTINANNCVDGHSVEVFVAGVSVGSGSTPGDGTPTQSGDAHFFSSDDLTGQSYDIKVDGVSVSSGTISYDCTPETHLCSAVFNASQDFTCEPTPTPTPTPTATPTPTPTPWASATPYPSPDASARPTLSPGTSPDVTHTNGYASEHTTIDNPEDIYGPINDTLNHDTGSNPDLPTPDYTPADYSDRGHIDDIEGQVSDQLDHKTAIVGAVSGTITGMMDQLGALSGASFGSVATIPMNFSTIGSAASAFVTLGLPTTIDLSAHAELISGLRVIMLWLLRIAFWIAIYKLFAGQGLKPV